jgi:hypothetical protein
MFAPTFLVYGNKRKILHFISTLFKKTNKKKTEISLEGES